MCYKIEVVNTYHTKEGEYIGRGTPLGNPFSHMKGTKAQHIVSSREEAVAKYRDWLLKQLMEKNGEIINELNRLLMLARQGNLKLRCFCAPKSCHGDVIKEYLEAQLKNEEIPW